MISTADYKVRLWCLMSPMTEDYVPQLVSSLSHLVSCIRNRPSSCQHIDWCLNFIPTSDHFNSLTSMRRLCASIEGIPLDHVHMRTIMDRKLTILQDAIAIVYNVCPVPRSESHRFASFQISSLINISPSGNWGQFRFYVKP